MRGRLPARPLAEVADAAVRVFTAKGFRPAGISDVARELGLSHGAVYTYADSKQGLLYLALLRVLDPEAAAALATPVVAPPPERFVEAVKTWAAARGGLEALGEGLGEATPESGEQAREELGQVVDGLYGFIEADHVTLKLFERCSEDLPELATWYYVEMRRGLLAALDEYLKARIDAGMLRPVPDLPVAARFIIETIAWFAMHRHGDADSEMLGDEACRRTVRDLVTAAFAVSATVQTPAS